MITYLNIIIFILVFFSVTFWLQFKLFISSLNSPKGQETSITNQKLLSLIYSKTGYQLDKIYLASSDKLFGIMPSFFKPHLIISQALYKSFNEDETEYVLLHEMGHFLLHHILTETILGLFLLAIGITSTIVLSLSPLVTVLLGFIFGIIMIRFGRLHEYEADSYSLSRMTNPTGMITATHKFQTQYNSPKNKLVEALFHRGNPFVNRIKMAEQEISKRRQK